MSSVKFIALFVFAIFCQNLFAQEQPAKDSKKEELIQFSGLILAAQDGKLTPVPWATVFMPGKARGTYADQRGFFTLIVEKKDVVKFNAVGFEPVSIIIPDTLTQDRYSVVQLMTQDTVNLPTTLIFPWPSKEHFKIEFLKMDVTPELQRRATANLANEYMAEARKNPDMVPYSGREGANFYLRQKSREYIYIGQIPPMNIFSPLAWAQFFKAWKEGKYKKQKKE